MLSIGKLAPGHAHYYEQSVAQGREDYYSGKGEEQGFYLGAGSEQLQLAGELANGDLAKLLRGLNPATMERYHERPTPPQKLRELRLSDGTIVKQRERMALAAFDLTFSAPKSVSVLWALTDGPVAADVKAAHTQAVRGAFDYLERVACVTRRGKGGKHHLRGDGLIASAFTHRSSRAGDPQLHTHVIVMNSVHAEDRYTSLHGTLLYRESKTAGYIYQAVLRHELAQRLGVQWGVVRNGVAEIINVDQALCERFSKRSEEIARQLALTGHTSARAANAAAIDTRASKTYDVDGAHLKERWIAEAGDIAANDVLDAINPVPLSEEQAREDRQFDHDQLEQLVERLFTPDGLTQHDTTFARRDVIRAVADQLPRGATVSELEAHADRILDNAQREIVELPAADPVPQGPVVRRADGTPLPDDRAAIVYSTQELVDAERSIVRAMRDRAHEGAAQVDPDTVRAMLDARDRNAPFPLQLDQRAIVENLTTSGHGMQVGVGIGGSGKTTSLQAANDIWTAAGIQVRGATISDAAARNLQAESGIESRTIATLKLWLDPTPESGYQPAPHKAFPPGGVLVIDEAGMVPTRDLELLARGAAEHGTKLVLIGDHRQLPEIEAGGSFKSLVLEFPSGQLVTNRRQHAEWERTALANLRDGDNLSSAITAYADHDRIHPGIDPLDLRRQLVSDWLDARDTGKDAAMIAYTRADVTTLNQLARSELDARGQLGSERLTLGGVEWAVGDELLALRNDRELGVSNGTRGRITHITNDEIRITQPDGTTLVLPHTYLDEGNATHGYAATGHKSQGQTINGTAFVLASDHIRREWLYVAMSRARDASHIYIDVPHRDPRTGLDLTPDQQLHTAILTLYDLAHRSDQHTRAVDHNVATSLSESDLNEIAKRDDLSLRQRERIAHEQARRDRELADRLVSNPPQYLLPIIGSVPLDPDKRTTWTRDAIRLEHHRTQHGLDSADMTRQLGNHILGHRQQERGRGRGG